MAHGASDTVREVCFIQNLLSSLGFAVDNTSVFGDNKGSLTLAAHPSDHQKSKHIEVRYFWIRQKVEERRCTLKYVQTTDQLADMLTKALPDAQHNRLALIMMGQVEPNAEPSQ